MIIQHLWCLSAKMTTKNTWTRSFPGYQKLSSGVPSPYFYFIAPSSGQVHPNTRTGEQKCSHTEPSRLLQCVHPANPLVCQVPGEIDKVEILMLCFPQNIECGKDAFWGTKWHYPAVCSIESPFEQDSVWDITVEKHFNYICLSVVVCGLPDATW